MALRPFAFTSSVLRRPLSPLIAHRYHSTSSSPPAFAPTGTTSADTQIPYGEPTLASSAYLPHQPSTPPPQRDPAATSGTPLDLTPRQREVLEKIIRVDQAGELGANYIYQGQHAVFKRGRDKSLADIVQVRLFPRVPARGN